MQARSSVVEHHLDMVVVGGYVNYEDMIDPNTTVLRIAGERDIFTYEDATFGIYPLPIKLRDRECFKPWEYPLSLSGKTR